MPVRHVIVDGSNLATEGRSLPSLAQLDQAVREFLTENPGDVVTVVVDASFGHRIDPAELPIFEEAEAAGEIVSPPAGAIGRGDAFLLRIAEKTGATVLSNDSFQEFHGEHPWLFEDGRLIGGKPVPGVGWIFMPRTPVRGQKSREVVKEAKRKRRVEDADGAGAAATVAPVASGLDLAASRSRGRAKKVDRAIARATEEAVEPKAGSRRRRRTSTLPPADPVNEPLAFITFIAAHPLGSEVTGTVAEFSSHGAFVDADGARCYLPLSAMGDPPPRRAREVVGKSEERSFVVQALDPQRRGIELALPGFAHIAGGPTEETVEAEIHPQAEAAPKRRRGQKTEPVAVGADGPVPALTATDGRKRAAPKKATVTKKAIAAKTPAPAPAPALASPPAPVPAKKAPARKGPAHLEPAGLDGEAPPASAKKVAAVRAKKAVAAKKAPPVKEAAPAKKAAPAKRATAAKKAAPAKETAPDAETSGAKSARAARRSGAAKAPAPPEKGATVKRGVAKKAPAQESAPAGEPTVAKTAGRSRR